MPSLPTLKPKQVARALERTGFYLARQRGNLLVTIPMHAGDLNPITLRSILRQAKMTVEELLELL